MGGLGKRLIKWCGPCAKKHHVGAINLRHKKCEDCKVCLSAARGLSSRPPPAVLRSRRVQVIQPLWGLPAEGKARWCAGCAKVHQGARDIKSAVRARPEHAPARLPPAPCAAWS